MSPAGRTPLTPLAAATTAIIYLQIIVGALMRHMHAGLAIPDFPLAFGHLVPPMFSMPIAVNFAHRCGAVVVTVMVLWTVARVLRQYGDEPAFRRPALGLLVLLAVQIGLGAATILSRRAVFPTTSHVAVGAAVLATCLALTSRAWHLEHAARSSGISEERERARYEWTQRRGTRWAHERRSRSHSNRRVARAGASQPLSN